MSTEALKVESLTRRFGEFVANDNVSFTLESGQILGIIGPNGAGKSTLIDGISGFGKLYTGAVNLFGTNVTNHHPEFISSKSLFRTFQTPRCIGELSVLSNLMLAGRSQDGEGWLRALVPSIWHEEESLLSDRCIEVLNLLDLDSVAENAARDISFGQVKLLNFGMALVGKADLLVLDEPVAGLSQHLRKKIANLIRDNVDGRTYLIIEHDFDFLRNVADRLILMNQGEIILEGTPDTVLEHQTTLDAFLGYAGK